MGKSPQRDLAALHRRSRSYPSPCARLEPTFGARATATVWCGRSNPRLQNSPMRPWRDRSRFGLLGVPRLRPVAVPNVKLCPGRSVLFPFPPGTTSDGRSAGRGNCRMRNGVKLPGRKLDWVCMILMHPWGGALDLPGYRRGQKTRNCREINVIVK